MEANTFKYNLWDTHVNIPVFISFEFFVSIYLCVYLAAALPIIVRYLARTKYSVGVQGRSAEVMSITKQFHAVSVAETAIVGGGKVKGIDRQDL